MTEQVYPKSDFRVPRNQLKNGLKASWTRLFFIFCDIWWFFKVERAHCKNLAKYEEKCCSTMPSTYLSKELLIPDTRVSSTRSATFFRSWKKTTNNRTVLIFAWANPIRRVRPALFCGILYLLNFAQVKFSLFWGHFVFTKFRPGEF